MNFSTDPTSRLDVPSMGAESKPLPTPFSGGFAERSQLPSGSSVGSGEPGVRSLHSLRLEPGRLLRAKVSFNARRLMPVGPRRLLRGSLAPHPGDLVLARVVALGQHGKLQLPSGRRSELFVGDEVVVAYGDRYAPNQWEARIPGDLGACHLVAAGGLAGTVVRSHARMKPPTELEPLGLLGDARGRRLNLCHLSLEDPGLIPSVVPTLVVVGASMDSGKTTTAAALVRGLTRAGLRVGAAKVTGTGACGDLTKFLDSGACSALDFVDAGLPTTFGQPKEEIERVVRTLAGKLIEDGVDALVIEVADGLLQKETAELLRSSTLRGLGAGMVFAAGEALGVIEGSRRLVECGHDLRAISGVVTASPLASAEASAASPAPLLDTAALETPETSLALLHGEPTAVTSGPA